MLCLFKTIAHKTSPARGVNDAREPSKPGTLKGPGLQGPKPGAAQGPTAPYPKSGIP